jgi:hypothetical protein
VNNAPAAADPAALTKVTVYCTPRSMSALDKVTDATGDSKTDSINRAIQLYAELVAARPGGGFTYLDRHGERHVWVTDTRPGRASFTLRLFGRWRRK